VPRKRAKRKSRRAMAAALATLGLGIAALALMTADRGHIYPNVFVSGQSVSGLSRSAVRRLLARAPIRRRDSPIMVRIGDVTHRCAIRDTGITPTIEKAVVEAWRVGRSGAPLEQFLDRVTCYWRRTDVAIPMQVDAARMATFVSDCARRSNRKPVNAEVEVSEGRVTIKPGRPGIEVDSDAAIRAVRGWASGGCRGDLRLPARLTGALVTAEQLTSVDTVLASVRTPLSGSSRNRRHNIALAAAAVSGHVLMPEETFSYNAVVGPRTEETGYRTAPVIRSGKLVPGTGGGACQLSSTLYQAALRAGLEIVARSHHSRPVAYTPAGLDATVAYPVIDLKFRNGFEGPVVLRARVHVGRLECQVLGPGPASKVELARQVHWIQPPEPRIVEDATVPPGKRVVEVKARRGVRVRVYRRQADAAAGRGQLISTDYYAAEAAVIRHGSMAGKVPTATKASLGGAEAAPGTASPARPAVPSGLAPAPGDARRQPPTGPKKTS